MSDVGVGVDDLNVYGSTLAVDADALLVARGMSAGRLAQWRLAQRSLVAGYEDPVTLAVNAASPVLAGEDLSAFGLLLVATESGLDYAKPISSYVQEWLSLPSACFHAEVKHACFGGTAALLLAADWVRANPGRKALVITTDLSRVEPGHPAEPAEGTGAAAMVVAQRPRVLELDQERGFVSREIYDVARPTATKTVVESELSVSAYLDFAEAAWNDYQSRPGAAGYDALDYLVCHTPLVPLVAQAHAVFAEESGDESSTRMKFERKVAPSLRYTRLVGNTFSGCVYVCLAGLVDSLGDTADTEGVRVGLYSYGSGSCAAFLSGTLVETAAPRLRRHRIGAALAKRRTVDVKTYDALGGELARSLTSENFEPDLDTVPGHFAEAYAARGLLVLSAVKGYYRTYRWS